MSGRHQEYLQADREEDVARAVRSAVAATFAGRQTELVETPLRPTSSSREFSFEFESDGHSVRVLVDVTRRYP